MKKVIKLLGVSAIAVGFLAACDADFEDPNNPGLNDPTVEDPADPNPGVEDPAVDDGMDDLEDGGF